MVSQTTAIASIANGHAFQKHVIDGNEFQNAQVKTQEDLARHIQDTINSPDTLGAATYDNRGYIKEVYLSNPKSNTLIIMSPSKELGDVGTIYQPSTGAVQKFNEITVAARAISIKGFQQINAAINEYSEGLERVIDRKPDPNNPDNTTTKTIRQNMQSPENLSITAMLDARAPTVLAAAEKSAQERTAALEAERTAQRDAAIAEQNQAGVRKEVISVTENAQTTVTADKNVVLIENADANIMIEKNTNGTLNISFSQPDGTIRTELLNPAQSEKLVDGLQRLAKNVDIKGSVGNAVVAAVAAVAALTSGASYAEAAQAGTSAIAPYSTKTFMNDNTTMSDYIKAAMSDVAASVAPETVETYLNDGDALELAKSASKDVAVGSAFLLGCEASAAAVSPSLATGLPGAALTTGACLTGGIISAYSVDSGLDYIEESFEAEQPIENPFSLPDEKNLGAYTTIVKNIPQGDPVINFDRGDMTVSGEKMCNVFDKSANPANENIERVNARELPPSVIFQTTQPQRQMCVSQ